MAKTRLRSGRRSPLSELECEPDQKMRLPARADASMSTSRGTPLSRSVSARFAREIEAAERQARIVARVDAQDLVFVVADDHGVIVERDAGRCVAGAGEEARGRRRRRGGRCGVADRVYAFVVGRIARGDGDRAVADTARDDRELTRRACSGEREAAVRHHRRIAARAR